MRRLTLLPCPESWERMRPDGDGRHCERCSLRVTELAALDGAGLDELLAQAEAGRACARVELHAGRPRIATGLAAGVLIAALATGCASPPPPPVDAAAFAEFMARELGPDDAGAVISGAVRWPAGQPMVGAIVVLQSTQLPAQLEAITDERGFYVFKRLPPGNYMIQVLYERANVSRITTLSEGARFRANFALDPDNQPEIMLGMLSLEPTLGTSPASSYSSKLIEYH